MKTFKLISLHMLADDGLLDITLHDGLMINQEEEHNRWLMEAFTDVDHFSIFDEARKTANEVTAHVVITKKENEPALFLMRILTVKQIGDKLSVLAQGHLKRMGHYAETLLRELLEMGLTGDELLQEFREKLANRPRLKLTK